MNTIDTAIKEFRQKRLAVYKADPQQIVRDTRGAERATNDHTGRWLFELLQNSDDVKASEVRILIGDNTVYVADNGCGLKPEAISAICGTDFSDKASGTIGRKGVGFKSVYEVSSNPQVLTVNGEGIKFSPTRVKEWLRQNDFEDEYVPCQWIPFFVSWDEARRQNPVLGTLGDHKTVVVLHSVASMQQQKVEQILKQWPLHTFFAFRNVRKLSAPCRQVTLVPGDTDWTMNDSQEEGPRLWHVAKYREVAPSDLLTAITRRNT